MVECLPSWYCREFPNNLDLSVGQERNMAKSKAVMALAKVMIAAAWADGSINNDEINKSNGR